jgi:hypothetical protein
LYTIVLYRPLYVKRRAGDALLRRMAKWAPSMKNTANACVHKVERQPQVAQKMILY